MTSTQAVRGTLAASAIGIGLLGLAGCALDAVDASPTPPPATQPTTEPTPDSVYVDGTYVAAGDYQAPSGIETVSVTVTLSDDVVSTVTVTGDAVDHEAVEFQERFAGGIAAEVVGRDITGLSVSRVAGSSLTSAGFNAAVDQIRAEAIR